MTVPAIDVRGLVKTYGNRTVVDHVDLTHHARAHLRLSRAQRLGQDDDAAHDLRTAHARWRSGHLPRP